MSLQIARTSSQHTTAALFRVRAHAEAAVPDACMCARGTAAAGYHPRAAYLVERAPDCMHTRASMSSRVILQACVRSIHTCILRERKQSDQRDKERPVRKRHSHSAGTDFRTGA
eukprot:6178037-Pleurochrysis_carterae.AAC.1